MFEDEWVVYHSEEPRGPGQPCCHPETHPDGPGWYFRSTEYHGIAPYSDRYLSRAEALSECRRWAAECDRW